MSDDDDDFDDELRAVLDLPPWKAQEIMQEKFNEADAQYGRWQMTSDAFTVETDKFGGSHDLYLKHKTTGKFVGVVEGSNMGLCFVDDVKKVLHFKSEQEAMKLLAHTLEQKQFDF